MLKNKRVRCKPCGAVWTTRAPLSILVCSQCQGTFKDLEVASSDHFRSTRKGGAVVWSGPLAGGKFFLITYPDGRVTATLKP